MALKGSLWGNIEISLLRAGIGFGICCAVGIPLGVLIGMSRTVERYINSLFEIFRQLSPLSLLPVFILIFGIGEDTKILIVIWGAFWPIFMNTISGVRNTPPLLVRMARSMGAGRVEIIRNIILPSASPEIFTGIRMSASLSLVMLTAAEMVGANSGIGYLILYSQQVYKIPNMYGGIIMLALLGLVINFVLGRLEKRVLHWREAIGNSEEA
jgi:NitT/TauT family transport system permease protein